MLKAGGQGCQTTPPRTRSVRMRWKRTFEGLREGRTFHLFHLVCISPGTTGFALGFLFLGFGLWCLFGFLLCFLVRCLGNFDLIFILIPLLTDNVTHSTGNAGKKNGLGVYG